MAFFRNSLYDDSDVSFAPVFRFIDAFDNFQRGASGSGEKELAKSKNANANSKNNSHQHLQARSPFQRLRAAATFNPRFDVVETKDAYELHGEIPGAQREDVTIEFTEPQTIVIRGRVERSHSSASDDGEEHEGQEKQQQSADSKDKNANSHKATVSDEEEEEAREAGKQLTTKPNAAAGGEVSRKAPEPTNRYWVQERSIGEFSRTFTFPVRVDEGNVKATLNQGVLTVTVPKQEKPVNRRIDIL